MLMIAHTYGITWRAEAKSGSSQVHLGWSGEEHAALLLGAEIARESDPRDQPFDLLWNGARVEVKTARPSADGPSRPHLGWTFGIGHNDPEASDLVFLIACAPDGMPLHYFLIPRADVGRRQTIRISGSLEGKWMQYEVRPRVDV